LPRRWKAPRSGYIHLQLQEPTFHESVPSVSPTSAIVRFADAAIEASDGTIYFSDGSARFGFDRWVLDFMEASSTGRLLKHDPGTGKVSVVLDNLAFANGVALSRDETFIIVCESWRYVNKRYLIFTSSGSSLMP
jgi:sugar lactone lactonase YvrE